MKYIKSFNEKVIQPKKLGDFEIKSFDDLVKYSELNDFDVVGYDEFYKSLDDSDKKTAPPNFVPFFALFNPKREKIMFVLSDDNLINMPNFKEILDDIIGHESIHKEQNKRRNIKYKLPNPKHTKDYFSNKDEIMAFSWTIANGLSKVNKTLQDSIIALRCFQCYQT